MTVVIVYTTPASVASTLTNNTDTTRQLQNNWVLYKYVSMVVKTDVYNHVICQSTRYKFTKWLTHMGTCWAQCRAIHWIICWLCGNSRHDVFYTDTGHSPRDGACCPSASPVLAGRPKEWPDTADLHLGHNNTWVWQWPLAHLDSGIVTRWTTAVIQWLLEHLDSDQLDNCTVSGHLHSDHLVGQWDSGLTLRCGQWKVTYELTTACPLGITQWLLNAHVFTNKSIIQDVESSHRQYSLLFQE